MTKTIAKKTIAKKNVLELFSGTHSVGKVCEDYDMNVVSVDLDNHFKPTHNVDIMDFDYKQYPQDHFHYIHASPPCILFSINQISFLGRKKRHNITGEMVIWTRELLKECMDENSKIIFKCLEIIDYFNPKYYTMENPFHYNFNCLTKQPYMDGLAFEKVDYCMYDYPIKKPTCFFNNFNLKLRTCDKCHKHTIWDDFGSSKYNRYVIPELLCREIVSQIMNN